MSGGLRTIQLTVNGTKYQKQAEPRKLLSDFMEQTETVLKRFLKENEVNIRDIAALINDVVHRIFYQQDSALPLNSS